MKLNVLTGSALTVYFLTCGSLYLWGFWLNYDLNILQFVDLSDIVKATIIPMITTLFLFAVNSITGFINDPSGPMSQNLWKAGGGYKKVVYLVYLFLFIMFITTGYFFINSFLNGTKAEKYFSIGSIAGIILLTWLVFKTKVLNEYTSYRGMILSAIILLPLVFMHKGIEDFKAITSGDSTYLVESDGLCKSKYTDEKFRYIGMLSDKGFALSLKDNSICIFKYNNIKLTKEHNVSVSDNGYRQKINTHLKRIFN